MTGQRRQIFFIPLLIITLCLVVSAQNAPWTRPAPQWSNQDARQILTESPWATKSTPQWVRDLSPDERRDSGNWEADIPLHGVGLEALIGMFGSDAGLNEAVARSHLKPNPGAYIVRWESERPVRVAEGMVADPDAPSVDISRFYAIAVHRIPTPKRWNIERELRGIAALKRSGKKDLKPSQVIILHRAGQVATVVYLFSRSHEISKRDGNLLFQAQIGRLVISHTFSTNEMQIKGQLEL